MPGMTSQESTIKEESPTEINGNDVITLIFPNYSNKPVRQSWRVCSLISIPYFRALLEGKWIDAKERTITLEDDPALFSKMVRQANTGSAEEQYNSMLDFYQVDGQKFTKKVHRYYKKFTFTKESLKQTLELQEASEARKIIDVKITSNISFGELKRRLLISLDGSENERADDINHGDPYGRFLELAMNAMIATDGKIGPIEMRIQIRQDTGVERITLPVFLYVCIIYKK